MMLRSCAFQLTTNTFLVEKNRKDCCLYSFKERVLSLKGRYNAFRLWRSNFNNQAVKINAIQQKEAASGELSECQIIWPSPSDEIPFWKRDFPSWHTASEWGMDNIQKDSDVMYIVHVAAEMAPIAKVGGLGDVVTGLARACVARGHKVEIFLPFYECIDRQQIEDLKLISTFDSFYDGNWVPTNIFQGVVLSVPILFIEPSNHFFKGQTVYGGSYNELEAYLFFSRAALEWMQVSSLQPDVIHVHEWQIGSLPLLYWDIYHHLSLKIPRIVLTVHNMEHYGECRQEQLSKCGLDGSIYAVGEKAVDDRTIGHNPERLSLLKGGIVYSNAVVTVSPTYVKETLRSGWLSSTLLQHQNKYSGILNGIDTVVWNPTTDRFLPAKFDATNIEGKKMCKTFVQKGLGLASEHHQQRPDAVPLVICVSRLAAQKGLHLIKSAIRQVNELGGQMIVLGKAPDPRVEREFESLAQLHSQGSSIRILLLYSEELSHMLYAAADIVLVPSLYEPCGLAQMIGMRYGAVPVVCKTGGLADTVFDMDDPSQPQLANGFVFEGIDEGSVNRAMDRAFDHYREKPEEWRGLVKKVMEIDHGWNRACGQYIDVYRSVRVRR